MNRNQNPSDALASILAILSQSTQVNAERSGLSSPSTRDFQYQGTSQNLDPVFAEDDILDTSQWIGSTTKPWHEPRNWQLPRKPVDAIQPPDTSSLPALPRATKRQRSVTPERKTSQSSEPVDTAPVKSISINSYAQALKHLIGLTHSEEFVETIKRMKRKQHDHEIDLLEERNRLKQKWESKRKMDKILQSLGSECIGDEVMFSFEVLKKALDKLEAADLRAYDQEIHRSWQEMTIEQSKQLAELGVPYFSTEHEVDGKQKILSLLEDMIQDD
jgi:hypothetical protein